MKKLALFAGCLLIAFVSGSGCGSGINAPADCSLTGVNVTPANATADHAAVPPGNSQQFLAFAVLPAGCFSTQGNLTNVTWSVSDPVNITISNTAGATYGQAICTGATSAPATVTATAPAGNGKTVTGTATLTCK